MRRKVDECKPLVAGVRKKLQGAHGTVAMQSALAAAAAAGEGRDDNDKVS
jgi:hypothetical protein